jgi:hypothetical protein
MEISAASAALTCQAPEQSTAMQINIFRNVMGIPRALRLTSIERLHLPDQGRGL